VSLHCKGRRGGLETQEEIVTEGFAGYRAPEPGI